MRLARARLRDLASLGRFVGKSFVEHRLTEVAASLTFTSLLALVPLMTISFLIISAVPQFSAMEGELESFIFGNFVPHAGETLREYLGTFRGNAGQLSAIGTIFLGVTSVMLLLTIERALNRIFLVRRQRPIAMRLLAFWALLTLGPVLFLVSISITSTVFAMAQTGGQEISAALKFVGRVVPFLLGLAGYCVLYTVMPYRRVRLQDALIGAGIAAFLFEALKSLFGLYITMFPTYQAIYGAISVLPILLLWIYLSWIITLGGAGIVAALPEWRGNAGVMVTRAPRAGRLALAIEALRLLKQAHPKGEDVRPTALMHRIKASPSVLEDIMALLEDAGFVKETRRHRWVIARETRDLTLYDLMLALNLQIRQPLIRGGPVPGLEDVIDNAIDSERHIFGVKLDEVLNNTGGATPVVPESAAVADAVGSARRLPGAIAAVGSEPAERDEKQKRQA
ncbi:MAG: YihY family inner membrane protein [Minwuia sp.]|uniref:YihY family inner membrane protein n=1 Tax=Minwuia sp. TaxID=2493630 RepID=UPI003A8A8897